MKNNYKFLLIILVAIFVVPQIALAAWWNPMSWGIWNSIFHFQKTEKTSVVCTMEAKQCPDGSYVGREGPKCEFKACPAVKKDEIAGWKTYDSGRGFYFNYPNDFTFDNGNSNAEQIIFKYNDGGQRFFVINIDKSDLSLEQYTKNTVKDLGSGNAQPATPVSITYKPYNFGGISGNMILSQAGDVLRNTDAMFLTKNSDSVFSFRYSYQAANASQDNSLKKIQEIISTFKFTQAQTDNNPPMTHPATILQRACLTSGGVVNTVDCYCSGTKDFYNTCAIGACTCPPNPALKKQVQMCDCGTGKCWDGTKCTNIASAVNIGSGAENLPINKTYAIINNFGLLNYNSVNSADASKIKSFVKITDGVSIKYGDSVKVAIVKSPLMFNYTTLEAVVNSYDKKIWDSDFVNPPAYFYSFKMQNKSDVGQQISLWYSNNYLVWVEGKNIFTDGSSAESILEAYLEKYPTSVIPSGIIPCVDSDGGKDYYSKGTVTCGGNTYVDHCDPSGALVEYVTDGVSIGTPFYNCPKGCADGVCIK